jgi:hypothetical protein
VLILATIVFCVQSWLARGFPVIHIKEDGGIYGSHDRSTDTRVITLDQLSFNMFEDCIRGGRPTSLILLTLFATVAHEFAHFMVTVGFSPPLSIFITKYPSEIVSRSPTWAQELELTATICLSRILPIYSALGSGQSIPRARYPKLGDVLEFLLFGGSLLLIFRGRSVAEELLKINAIWFKARGSMMDPGTRLGDLAIIGPWLAHHIMTTQPLPRLTVKIVRELMQEDQAITTEFMDIRAVDGTRWEMPLPQPWEIPDVEANFAGREIVDENDRDSIRMYRAVQQGFHEGQRSGRGAPLVPYPPHPGGIRRH